MILLTIFCFTARTFIRTEDDKCKILCGEKAYNYQVTPMDNYTMNPCVCYFGYKQITINYGIWKETVPTFKHPFS